MIGAVFPGSSETLGKVCRNRGSGPDHLIGQASKSDRKPGNELDGDSCRLDGLGVGDEVRVRFRASCMITSDSFMPPPPVDGISEVKGHFRSDLSCP